MKRRREGTLQRVELTPADGEAWSEALASISTGGRRTLEGTLQAAMELADEQMRQAAPLRAGVARNLRNYVIGARAILARAPDRRLIPRQLEELEAERFPWDARDMINVGLRIGLLLADLRAELADDSRSDRRRRITRAAYFKAKREHGTQERIAEHLGVSVQALRKWRAANLDE